MPTYTCVCDCTVPGGQHFRAGQTLEVAGGQVPPAHFALSKKDTVIAETAAPVTRTNRERFENREPIALSEVPPPARS